MTFVFSGRLKKGFGSHKGLQRRSLHGLQSLMDSAPELGLTYGDLAVIFLLN